MENKNETESVSNNRFYVEAVLKVCMPYEPSKEGILSAYEYLCQQCMEADRSIGQKLEKEDIQVWGSKLNLCTDEKGERILCTRVNSYDVSMTREGFAWAEGYDQRNNSILVGDYVHFRYRFFLEVRFKPFAEEREVYANIDPKNIEDFYMEYGNYVLKYKDSEGEIHSVFCNGNDWKINVLPKN